MHRGTVALSKAKRAFKELCKVAFHAFVHLVTCCLAYRAFKADLPTRPKQPEIEYEALPATLSVTAGDNCRTLGYH